MKTTDELSRRTFLTVAGGCFALHAIHAAGADSSITDPKAIAKAASVVTPHTKWDANALYAFLEALPRERTLELKRALYLLSRDGGLEELSGASQDARDIQKELLRLSTHSVLWPFRKDKGEHLNYHQLVTWVSGQAGVAPEAIEG